MTCIKCGERKSDKDFYFIDGGQGILDIKCEVCKDCIKAYNTKNGKKKYVYLKWQFIACYFGAKRVIEKKENIKDVTRSIENGYKSYNDNESESLEMAISNFLNLFGEKGLEHSNNKQKYVFDRLQKGDYEKGAREILECDYKTIKS